jgi:hypothetical protein
MGLDDSSGWCVDIELTAEQVGVSETWSDILLLGCAER